jgi:hypothetical protein
LADPNIHVTKSTSIAMSFTDAFLMMFPSAPEQIGPLAAPSKPTVSLFVLHHWMWQEVRHVSHPEPPKVSYLESGKRLEFMDLFQVDYTIDEYQLGDIVVHCPSTVDLRIQE